MRTAIHVVVACLFVCLLHPPACMAKEECTLSGRVLDAGGKPVADAVFEVLGERVRWKSDENGAFTATLAPGEYRLLVTSERHGSAVAAVTLLAGSPATLDVALSPVYRDEVVVSAGVAARPVSEVAQPIAVLSGERLDARQQPSLGATIANEPGVSTTSFGPAVGRPILRGLGADRVRILSNGTDIGDLSAGAPDHAVDANTATAERIEILRGAATLLYGSSAGGGVVNIIDGRIPETRSERALSGQVSAGYGSVARHRHADAQMGGTLGFFSWNVQGLQQRTSDYSIPGFASLEPEGGEERGTLRNSAHESTSGTAGGSWVGDRGFLGLALSRTDATYGLPGSLEEQAGGDGDPKIALRQDRLDLRGEWQRTGAFLEGIRLNAGANDYAHVEAESSEEFGQRNSQESYEARIELEHAALGSLRGSVGAQLRHRDVAIVGEEAFVPPSTTGNMAVFALEEYGRRNHRWDIGVRYERQEIEGEESRAPRRTYGALSSSLGWVWAPGPGYSIGVSMARAVKFPNAEELYSEGPHLSTRSYEIGNAGLHKEINLDADLSVRKLTGRLTGEINLFVNRFDDFIFQRLTDEVIEELPVLVYENGDAIFRGAELRGSVLLAQRGTRHLSLEAGLDTVQAELRETGEPLPRIPATELGGGLRYADGRAWAEVSVWRTARQTRVAQNESPTAGYTIVNVSAGWRIYTQRLAHDFCVRGSNLNNADIRAHTSFLKDLAPQPGRDIDLSYRITF
jgi:iron complex outermembrane receptor protein